MKILAFLGTIITLALGPVKTRLRALVFPKIGVEVRVISDRTPISCIVGVQGKLQAGNIYMEVLAFVFRVATLSIFPIIADIFTGRQSRFLTDEF